MTPSSVGQPLPMALAAIKRHSPFGIPPSVSARISPPFPGKRTTKKNRTRTIPLVTKVVNFIGRMCGRHVVSRFASDHEFHAMVMATLALTTRVYCPLDLPKCMC